jgi:Uma2 family endonuclease
MATTEKLLTAEEFERLPDDGKRYELIDMEVIPDLVVEILSKGDTIADVNDKIDDWLGAGVQLSWVVDPFRRTVTIYRPGCDPTLLGEHETLEGDLVVAGFRCSAAELFA